MNEVKTLGIEFLASDNSSPGIAFPSLEELILDDMHGLEIWSTSSGDDKRHTTLFPRLRQISITECPKLNQVSVDLIPSLRFLHLHGCSEEVLRSLVVVSSSIVSLSMNNIKGLVQLHEEVLRHLGEVEDLCIESCGELRYLWECESEACKFLVSLKKLVVETCGMLVSLGEREDHSWISLPSSVTYVELQGCRRLESFRCPNNIKMLWISVCGSMTSLTFPTMQDLPSAIKNIAIIDCEKLEESWLLNNYLSSLESLVIQSNMTSFPEGCFIYLTNLEILNCDNIESIPEKSAIKNIAIIDCEKLEESWLLNNYLSSLESLVIQSNMTSFPEGCFVYLTNLEILNCDNIESIPEKGFGFLPLFCLKTLSILDCKNLKSFPHVHLPSLTSLEELVIKDCPSLDDSFPCGLWPPNLRSLRIGCLNKPMSEWGLLQNFPSSLVQLHLYGKNSGVVSFAEADGVRNNTTSSSFLLPPSLTSLYIYHFEELESVSKGLQHLTCLERLYISSCPKLRDLPEKLLPSLSYLRLYDCKNKKLEKKCQSGTGKYWPIISQIPLFENEL